MPTIHMDIEQVKAVLELMTQDEQELRLILKNLNGAVTAIHGTEWSANAETQFQDEYSRIENRLSKWIDSVDLLAVQLRQEIAQWEAMAAKLA